MARRVLLVLALLCGGFWAIGAVLMDYPEKFDAAEELTDTWRPFFTDDAVQQARADTDAFSAFATQFEGDVMPALAVQLDMTPAEFGALAAANYPDTAAGLAQLGEIVPYFDGVVTGMEAQQDNFRKADAIPTKDLPAQTVPWILGVIGVVSGGAALVGLTRKRRSGKALVVAAGTGLVIVAATLALSVPSKALAFEHLTDAFRPLFSPVGVEQSRDYMDTVAAMAGEVQDSVLPGVASTLGTTPTQLVASLSAQYPDVGAVLPQLPGMLTRFEALVASLEQSAGDFTDADAVPTKGTPATWFAAQLAIPGLLLAFGVGLGGLLTIPATRREAKGAVVPGAAAT